MAMEQFDKWYIKNKDNLFCPVLTRRSRSDCEKTWKAALEWIYIEVTGTDLSTMRDMINEELNEQES